MLIVYHKTKDIYLDKQQQQKEEAGSTRSQGLQVLSQYTTLSVFISRAVSSDRNITW